MDGQSVKTTERGGARGFDAHKRVKGRKRHILVDTLGLPVANRVEPADTLWGAASWLFFRVACSTRIDPDMGLRSRLEKQPTDCVDVTIIRETVH